MRKLTTAVSLALCFSLVSPSIYASAEETITKEAITEQEVNSNLENNDNKYNSSTDNKIEEEQEPINEEPIPTPPTESKVDKSDKVTTNSTNSTSENTYATFFPDANLAKIIAKTVTGSEDINVGVTESQLQSITILDASNKNISNLAGIEHLTNLQSINLSSNNLTNINQLVSMPKLESINAANNEISSTLHLTTPASAITTLDLRGNHITELDIENQPKLTNLYINELEVQSLTLKNLESLDSIGRVAAAITIDWGELESITLSNLPKITRVDISGNYLDSDTINIENLSAVTSMDFSSNELTKLPQLNNLPVLTSLNVRNNKIDKLETAKLANLSSLKTINAEKQSITLPKTIAAKNLTISNKIENLAGKIVTPKTISNNGTYSNQNIIWSRENLTDLSKVSYTFDEVINSSTITGKYTGTVNQPVEVKALPVITADKNISYNPVNAVDEASFLRDIHASASENAQITSDYKEVVDFTTPGDYTVTLQATNSYGLEAEAVSILVHINDIQKPQVTVANSELSLEVGTELTSELLLAKSGANVTDAYDGDIKMDVDINEVDTNKLGTYEAFITAKSKSGASADPIKISVKIIDTEKPVIQVDNSEITVAKDSKITDELVITEAGITATDNYDEELSIHVDFSEVDTSKPGSYKAMIFTEDLSGNRSETIVTVKVSEAKVTEPTTQHSDSSNSEASVSNTITDELNKTIAKYIPSYKPNEKSALTLEKTSTKEIGKDLKAHLPTNQNPIKLPKTGENTDLIFVFIGVLMLAGLTTSKIKKNN